MGKITKITDKKVSGENRVEFSFDNNEERAFFVKFYENDLFKEFLEIKKYYSKFRKQEGIVITEKNGTYKVAAKSVKRNGFPSEELDAWDILMHKYMSLSREIRKENGVKFHPIRFSDSFISPELSREELVG